MTSEEDDKIMKLERNIPARKEIIKFGWVRKDFLKYSESFKNIRSNMSQKMDKCFWCKHNFLDNEPIALAQIIGKRNVVLCNNCADKLLPPKEQDNDKPDFSKLKEAIKERLGYHPVNVQVAKDIIKLVEEYNEKD